MADRFDEIIEHIFRFEGKFSDHKDDPGGRTNLGITQKTFDAWRASKNQTKEDVINISEAEAKHIYRKRYWEVVDGDQLPPALALVVMEMAVNSGPKAAIKALQKALNEKGAQPKLVPDGIIGPKTHGAIARANLEQVLDEYLVRRGFFYRGLPKFAVFGIGWARRLVSAAKSAYSLVQDEHDRQVTKHILPIGANLNATVKRYFYAGEKAQAYGTFFRCWGGWITARHVIEEMEGHAPEFATGAIVFAGSDIDAAIIGCRLPQTQPRKPIQHEELLAIGFPAGSALPSLRKIRVHLQRPRTTGIWIAEILAPDEPVVTGMSGGVVFDPETGEEIGIITHRNSAADLDIDGELEQSLDFVALSTVHSSLDVGL